MEIKGKHIVKVELNPEEIITLQNTVRIIENILYEINNHNYKGFRFETYEGAGCYDCGTYDIADLEEMRDMIRNTMDMTSMYGDGEAETSEKLKF